MIAIFAHPPQLNIPTVKERWSEPSRERYFGFRCGILPKIVRFNLQLCITQSCYREIENIMHETKASFTNTARNISNTGHTARASGQDATSLTNILPTRRFRKKVPVQFSSVNVTIHYDRVTHPTFFSVPGHIAPITRCSPLRCLHLKPSNPLFHLSLSLTPQTDRPRGAAVQCACSVLPAFQHCRPRPSVRPSRGEPGPETQHAREAREHTVTSHENAVAATTSVN